MLIYFVFLLVPLLMGFFHSSTRKAASLGVWIYFIFLLIFCGLRDEVGPDWEGYQNIFDGYQYLNIDEFLKNSEPGFFLLNKISNELGFGLYGVTFFCALIFLWGIFSFALKTANPWLAIAMVMPYLIFIISMSGIRQAAAIGFGFYIISRWEKSSLLSKILWIFLAITFHNSAVFFLFFVIYSVSGFKKIKIAATFLVGVLLIFSLRQTETFDKYQSVYIEQNVVSGGAYFHVLLSAFPAALYLWRRKAIIRMTRFHPVVDLAAFMALAAMPLVAVSSTGIDRLSLYLSFIQMWIYPALIQSYPAQRKFWKLFSCSIAIVIFFVYFIFGTHVISYLNYRNVLFT